MPDSSTHHTDSYAKLISLAVHEFRTPASVVGGYLRMLQSGVAGALSDGQKKIVGEAEKSCARLTTLLGELSDIGKMDAGTAPMSETPFDVFELIQDVAKVVHEAEDRDVHLELRGETTGAPVVADKTRMANAFSVFFRAVLREQATAATVVADRRLERGDGEIRAVIIVARAEAVQKTYEARPAPFDELRGGLGLGLPLARRVVEHIGGTVWTPGVGETPEAFDRAGLIVSLPTRSLLR